jgi:DNA-3-methyladenine glycosylase I
LRAMASTEASVALSKDLKKRGFTFVGPTTAYAFMQAMGLVNDHIEGCAVRPRVERARRAFHPPGIRSRAAPGSTTRPSARSRPRRHPTRD